MKGLNIMIDKTDKYILEELLKNSRIKMKELGEKVHMTGQATSIRIDKLEDRGVIEGYTVKLNYTKLGYPIHVILNIFHTKTQSHQPYIDFVEKQKNYVIHNYKVSGDSCYMLECVFPSNEVLNQFLEKLNKYVNYKITIILNDAKKSTFNI